MRQIIPLGLLATLALGSGRADGQTLSMQDFSDWNYYNNAGWRAAYRGDLEEAARRFIRASEIARPVAATAPKLLARSYADLAWILYQQGRAVEAEPLALWALDVRLKQNGEDSEPAAQSFYEVALIFAAQQKCPEAETCFQRSIEIWEKRLGPSHSRLVPILNDFASLLTLQRKLDKAEAVYRRVVALPERTLPTYHHDRLISLIGLASLDLTRGEKETAEAMYDQILGVVDKMPAVELSDLSLLNALRGYVAKLRSLGRSDQAEKLEARVLLRRSQPRPRPSLSNGLEKQAERQIVAPRPSR
jgi:tetratricopeptide (TPR) repeat protein